MRVLLAIIIVVSSGCALVPSGESPPPFQPRPIYKVGNPYVIDGKRYVPKIDYQYDETGIASWYGDEFADKPTANGEIFDPEQLTAAHKTLPMPSYVRVTNLSNKRTIVLRVNDRGPFIGERIIDLSRRAARELGFLEQGKTLVRVQILRRKSLEAAARAGNKLAEKMLNVEPSPYEPNPDEPSVAGRHYVQIAAYRSRRQAEHLIDTRISTPDVIIEETENTHGTRFYRVRLGPFTTREQAQTILNQANRQGFNDAFIVDSK
ncbi:MAG: septal ring lytic transglycosylase RlpA family protein [Alphaproteobacteria bacterium GM202ARS2]|nr:septal ring lytic transglycosylase RlpA family protein [Alphaproteobacteria bacterium GM202ARS2]